MGGDAQPIGPTEAASLLGWWLEMGVDVAVQEEPRDWLKPAPARPPHRVGEAAAPFAEPRQAEIPESLDLFRDWLATSPPPAFAAASTRRVMPAGIEGAAVMLLADLPAGEDSTAGQPIGGDAWALTTRMLAAIGIVPDQAYVASLSCFHVPGARPSPDELEQCAALARRHVALARPKRLLLLGDGPARALLGKPVAQARGHVHRIEGVRTVATFPPRHLIKRPADKALAWRDLLLLMEDEG